MAEHVRRYMTHLTVGSLYPGGDDRHDHSYLKGVDTHARLFPINHHSPLIASLYYIIMSHTYTLSKIRFPISHTFASILLLI